LLRDNGPQPPIPGGTRAEILNPVAAQASVHIEQSFDAALDLGPAAADHFRNP
jgi:hypothetical protein